MGILKVGETLKLGFVFQLGDFDDFVDCVLFYLLARPIFFVVTHDEFVEFSEGFT